jgi:hypothetical protein
MTVKVSKPAINVREELADLRKPTGVAGEAMLRAETPQEQFNLIGAGRRNLLINGDMRIAQAATSITTIGTGGYQACDRWRIQTNLNHTTHTWAQVADAPDGFKYSSKLTVGTGVTPSTGDFGRLYQRMEVQDAKHLQWGTSNPQPVTLSFWVKSSIAGQYGGVFSASGTGVYVFAYNVNQADVWEYKTYTVTDGMTTFGAESADNGIGFGVCFDLGEGSSRSSQEGQNPTTSAGTMGLTGGVKILATSGATWQITGVQLEQNKFATSFERRHISEELALCKRYYQRSELAVGTAFSYGEARVGSAQAHNASWVIGNLNGFVQMRSTPSVTNGSHTGATDAVTRSGGASTSCNFSGSSMGHVKAFNASSFTANEGVQFTWAADAEL